MECPKCGYEIDDKALVCPNCKKVLKLVCPICKTVNENNICKKCGYVIISKCNKCGKINQTINKKCKKCGFDTERSVILNESNTDDFVLMTIDFPNMDDMKNLLGSVKLLNKFKINIDKIILDYTKSNGLRRQLIKNTYVIRCCKDYSFKASAHTAMTTAIELLNSITKMNCKLTKKKNATVRCNIFLMKRSVNDNPDNFDSGYNISLLNQYSKNKEDKILNTFQIITDQNVFDVLGNDYRLTPLNSVMINNEMVMYYEADVRDKVKVEYPQDDEDDEIKIPNFVQNMLIEQDKIDGEFLNNPNINADIEAIYDIKPIEFEDIKCDFIRTENIDIFYHIANKLQTNPKSILALKTADLYKPYSLKIINTVESLNLYNNIITITCYDEMKYSPYSFFRDLVSAIFEYTVSQKLFSRNDFSMFASVDPDGLIKDLVMLKERNVEVAEDTRYVFFDIFLTLLQAIPNTLIYVENFEKIDSASYDVLKFLFDAFDKLDVSYLLCYGKGFSLHKDSHFLISRPYYCEITLKPTAFEKMIEENKNYYRNILDNFYFHRIAKYSCGSILYLDIAIQYLIELGVYEAKEDCIDMINPKTIIIPSNISRLMKRRLNLLKDDMESFRFLVSVVLLGTRIDLTTLESLGFENMSEFIDKLTNMGYIYFYNNCMYFPDFNLLRECILDVTDPVTLKEISKSLFEKVMDESMPSPSKAFMYKLIGDRENELSQWEKLARINLSLGDFNAYLNCTAEILKILNENTDEEKQPSVDEYKMQLYEEISQNLYQYIPNETPEVALESLQKLEETGDAEKIIFMCNKLIQGNLISGNYMHALELTHKVLSLLPVSSLNPADGNFNTYFFLMSLIHIHILFNIGALNDCIDVGFKVLNVVNENTIPYLKPEYISSEDFRMMIVDAVGYVAMANVLVLGGNVHEFLKIVRNDVSSIPASYDLFTVLQDFMHGKLTSFNEIQTDENDKFGSFITHILNAFLLNKDNSARFAEEIYKAKISAGMNNLHQLELFADLMIGSVYADIESYQKAEYIINKVIKTAEDKGMSNLLYAAWYVLSCLKLKLNKYNAAFGIINNSLIQLEKNNFTSEYLIMIYKYNMYKVLMFQKEFDKAQICISQAKYIASKYGINYKFDENPDSYIPVDETDDDRSNPVSSDEFQDEESEVL